MIITRLKASLEYKMFNYSTTRALSLRTGAQLKLTISGTPIITCR